MNESGVRVRGSVLRARMWWARDQGDEEYRRFLAALSPDVRDATEAGFDSKAWYPFATFIELCETLDRLHGNGDLTICYEVGRFACEANINSLYRLMFKVAKIGFVIRRSAAAWRLSYDAGELKLVAQTRKSVTMRIVDFPAPHRAHCLSVKGFMLRAAELAGENPTETYERCRALGDDVCEFSFRW